MSKRTYKKSDRSYSNEPLNRGSGWYNVQERRYDRTQRRITALRRRIEQLEQVVYELLQLRRPSKGKKEGKQNHPPSSTLDKWLEEHKGFENSEE